MPGPQQVQIRIGACGVCRTDLHIIDGELKSPKLPLIPGHEIVGKVTATGAGVKDIKVGDRVGVPWLASTCQHCAFCMKGQENLCDKAKFTGYTVDGGYADYAIADASFTFHLPEGLDDVHAAPLLCAGLIGFRALRFAGEASRIGFFGFGAAAHIAVQVAKHRGQEVYAFTRPGDLKGQDFARELGSVWAGGSEERPPKELDAALIFAPVGSLVPKALSSISKGGSVICAGIHMSDIPAFPYEALWGERVVRSVTNLTRNDGDEFFKIAAKVKVRTITTAIRLEDANTALSRLRNGELEGAAVLVP